MSAIKTKEYLNSRHIKYITIAHSPAYTSMEIARSLGVQVNEVRATGGGAKSAFWKQLQADILNSGTN